MGIEIFDEATLRLKEKMRDEKQRLQTTEAKLEHLEKTKERYEEKIERRKGLMTEISEQKKILEEKQEELTKQREEKEKYDWLKDYENTHRQLNSTNDVKKGVLEKRGRLGLLQKELKSYNQSLEKHQQLLTRLEGHKRELERLAEREEGVSQNILKLEEERERAIKETGLNIEELSLIENLPQRKSEKLTSFGISILISVILVALGFLVSLLIFPLAIASLIAAGYLFFRYKWLDTLQSKTTNLQTIDKQLQDLQVQREGLMEERDSLLRKSGYDSPEQIIRMFREAEVGLAQGQTAAQVCRTLGIAEQTFYRWRREYGGLKIEQAKRLKALEQENTRLKRAVAELTLDKLILQEAVRGNF